MIRTLSVEGGIMGDFNFLSKFSEMIMCYFGIFKDILSSLRKPGPGDCYFCPCLGVSAFQIGKWGFSSRVGNFFFPLPSPFQSRPITSKTALPQHLLLCFILIVEGCSFRSIFIQGLSQNMFAKTLTLVICDY